MVPPRGIEPIDVSPDNAILSSVDSSVHGTNGGLTTQEQSDSAPAEAHCLPADLAEIVEAWQCLPDQIQQAVLPW